VKTFLLVASLAASLLLGTESSDHGTPQSEGRDTAGHEAFPITVDFHCPRNFGFHIGDEIALVITVNAQDGHIVDLVNLPQKDEAHGPFEVRDVMVQRCPNGAGNTYTVAYRLQSFEPAIAVDKVKFPPLRVSYATEKDWNPVESKYHYRSLLSQPFDIFVSRTAAYYGPMKDIKGPLMDKMAALVWKVALVFGGFVVFMALITWPWEFIRKRGTVGGQSIDPTPKDRLQKELQEARERCFNYEDHRKHLFFEINRILRDFLKDVYGLNTANRPSMEIVGQLKDNPFYEELHGLVTRINQVIYEGEAPVDVESVMRQFGELMGRICETIQQGTEQT
jgi:hypothetical protein